MTQADVQVEQVDRVLYRELLSLPEKNFERRKHGEPIVDGPELLARHRQQAILAYEATRPKVDEAARLALGLRADLDDILAKGVRYTSDMTIRVDDMRLRLIFRRASELHERLVPLSPTASAARAALTKARSNHEG